MRAVRLSTQLSVISYSPFVTCQLFPSWQGNFDGSRPSLTRLDNEFVIAALQHGLISEPELKSLLHLIRSPDVSFDINDILSNSNPHAVIQSHFLKVPSLPFHSLISVLSKFPTDDDSRVFWSNPVRDLLYGESFYLCDMCCY